MCGFVVCLNVEASKRDQSMKVLKKGLGLLVHRGPDESLVLQTAAGNLFGHTRLAIVAPDKGTQPICHRGKTWVHNGEIYNHLELKKLTASSTPYEESDSAAIGVAFDHYGEEFVSHLDGVFALALEFTDDVGEVKVIVARDPLGVKPLFYGQDQDGGMWFASEMKALVGHCLSIETFPPGTMYLTGKGFIKYYQPEFRKRVSGIDKDVEEVKEKIATGLEAAVKKRLMGDVPMGALLSGGLDSSLVAALAARELKKKGERLTTFSVGLESSTMDLEKAKLVAEHIGSDHYSITYTVEEGIDAIKEMVGLLESYDVTTIRASTPMLLMSKAIKRLGIKSVLSGEGADEIFGGYLYFAHAPSAQDFHDECLRRVAGLHKADLLRADRSTMGASVEARVPFLDLEFLEMSMGIDARLKVMSDSRPEKWILREAFRGSDLLPDEVLWRQKEQFSDGVGYEWVDGLKDLAEALVSDDDFSLASTLYPFNTPSSKEAFLYRRIFSEIYKHPAVEKQTSKWIPRWQDYNTDPSGRANKVHAKTTEVQHEIFATGASLQAGK